MTTGRRNGGRVVPTYAFTQGRTRAGGQTLPLEALVTATEFAVEKLPTLQVERRAIVRMSMRPTSVRGFLAVHLPPPTDAVDGPGHDNLGETA